ncbi:MAG: WD40 repeat domain-containing serine/threonine protein kinase [Anaerolineales bacterium]|nr:WD40 repeat domain-containing serine/threonine protein kinase [Anaerolineales bacterium]MCX7756204.1 WD40 repeat domain-containing serine/threonine protein kinase [Anaerolineales bacterium]MDW8277436.1 WD40 repeat domain-containing serine/threonine protein kinase [Anaerolineales bacterium]
MTVQKFGRYEIKSELGRGGMATVYKAFDPLPEREVALKVLPREMLHDPQFRVRFEREIKTVAALEHPAIVPIYDVGEENGQPYYVMRYMPGGSLQDRIAQGPLSLQETARIFTKLAPALDEAHAKGIIHRDLKPGNILFDRAGEPYISDFGIAKITQTQGATVTGGAIIGTPAYMSPEQAQGDQVDGRSDIYALGVILFEMLSGVQPYQATTPMAVVVKHLTEPIPHILDSNPNLPPDIEPVIEKAMAKNREERFGTAAELADAISEVARGASGQEAIKTASMRATQVAAAKTRLAAAPTKVGEKPTAPAQPQPAPARRSAPAWWLIAPVILLFLAAGLGGGGYFLLSALSPTATMSATNTVAPPPPPTNTLSPSETPTLSLPTDTPVPPTATPTFTPQPPTSTPTPARPVIGGADMLAFIANNEIWTVNLDGSELTQLTKDGLPKSDLQWIPGTRDLVYITGTSVKVVNADTRVSDVILSFPGAKFLEAFRISPDGKQVAISLNKEMYIVPFDREKFKGIRGRDGLRALNGCLGYTPGTKAAIALKEFRWGPDGKTVAWSYAINNFGNTEDVITLVDISTCDPNRITIKDQFPASRFRPEDFARGGAITDFDWDGGNVFIMNTAHRNDGWGFLYLYNLDIRQGQPLNPLNANSRCCYRDARWSPDGTYLFLAFQNKDTLDMGVSVYYVPVSALETGVGVQALSFPEEFFKNPKESPQFALHRAQ